MKESAFFKILSNRKGQWATLLFLSLIWGSSFILMKKGLESYSNSQVAAFRLFFSFLFLLPVIIKNFKVLFSREDTPPYPEGTTPPAYDGSSTLRKKEKNGFFRKFIQSIHRQYLKSLLIVGFFGVGIPAFLFTTAQTRIDSALAGVLNSLTPLFTLMVGVLFYKSKATLRSTAGVIIGLIGAVGLMYKDAPGALSGINWYALFAVAATVCYGITVNEVKTKLHDLEGTVITALGFMFVGPWAGIYLLFSDFSPALKTPHYLLNLGFITILALFSSVIALIIFNSLIKYTTTLFAASVTYIIPVFAILWGIFDGEKLTLLQFAWIAVILFGVFLVNAGPPRGQGVRRTHRSAAPHRPGPPASAANTTG